MSDTLSILTPTLPPVLALIVWTLIMFLWMYAKRIPAMQKAKIDPQDARHPGTYSDRMPSGVRAVADNYNHLHEQPTIFYALAFFATLTGGGDYFNAMLLWGYVILRIVHSLVQVTVNIVMIRFMLFALSTLLLMIMAVREGLRITF